jgi:hypothetical protein
MLCLCYMLARVLRPAGEARAGEVQGRSYGESGFVDALV